MVRRFTLLPTWLRPFAPRSRSAPPAPRTGLVELEARDCPAITFQFDYRFDTPGYYTDVRKALLERAAAVIGAQLNDQFAAITPGGANSWAATLKNPTTNAAERIENLVVPANTAIIFVGSSDKITELANAGPNTGFENLLGDAAFQKAVVARGQTGIVDDQNNFLPVGQQTDTAFWGGNVQYNRNTKFFESLDSRDPNDPARAGPDFFDTAVHELGHIFGLGTSQVWDNKLQDAGGGKFVFTGANAVARFGQNVPVEPLDAMGQGKGHWDNGTLDGGKFNGMNTSDDAGDYRNLWSRLDMAGLRDLGWELATDADGTLGTATNTKFTTGGAGFQKADQIEMPLDVDVYRFTGTANAKVTIATSRPAGQPAVDTFLRVFDAAGKPLDFDDNSGADPNYSKLVFTVPADGDYFVGVSSAPNTVYQPEDKEAFQRVIPGGTGNYTLTIGEPVVGAPTPPTAAVGATPPVDASFIGANKYDFTVVYTATTTGAEIDASSLDAADVTVTGPFGFVAPVTFVSATPGPGNATPLTATYRFEPPGGTWDATDDGDYAIALVGDQVRDTAGAFAAGAALKTLAVNLAALPPDAAAPTAKLASAPPVAGRAGERAPPYTFTVTYADDVAVDAATFDGMDVRVTGPNNFNALGKFAFADMPLNGTPRTVTYTVVPPGGQWTEADNGTYTIAVEPNQVRDTAGKAVPAGPLGTFTVAVVANDTDAPTAKLGAAAAVGDTSKGATAYDFTVTYADNVALDATSFDGKDVRVTGPNSFNTLAAFVKADVAGNGTPRTVTYRITPPGGSWDSADNGKYTIAVESGQVLDTSGNKAAPATVGTFAVSVSGAVVPSPVLVGFPQFAAGTDAGGNGAVTFYNPDKTVRFTASPFGTFAGGVRTAAADFTGDGVADVVAGTGPGRATRVVVLDGATQKELFAVDPFEASFQGGVYVAAGDLNGDGRADLVISPDEGGGPRVRAFSGNGFGQIADFFGIEDTNFRGGARAAVGDVTGDGRGDLVVAAGFGGGPRVAVFDGTSLANGALTKKPFGDFFAFETGLRNGVFITAGDVDGDGKAELVAGGGPGGGPRVTAFSGADLLATPSKQTAIANFFAGDVNNRGGVRLAVKNLDADGRADLVVGSGAGAGSRVTSYLGKTIAAGTPPEQFAFDAFAGFTGGVFVG